MIQFIVTTQIWSCLKLPLTQLIIFYDLDQRAWWVWIFFWLGWMDSSLKKKLISLPFFFIHSILKRETKVNLLLLLLLFLNLKFSKTTNDGILGELYGNSLNSVDERSTLNMSKTIGLKWLNHKKSCQYFLKILSFNIINK